jgi:hypothetical protein
VQSRVIALVIDKPPSSAFDLFLNILFDLNYIAYGLSLYFRVLPIHGFGLRLREGGGGTATGGWEVGAGSQNIFYLFFKCAKCFKTGRNYPLGSFSRFFKPLMSQYRSENLL